MKIFLRTILILLAITGCSKDFFSGTRNSLITGCIWKTDHCINTVDNSYVTVNQCSYHFNTDGTYSIESDDGTSGQGYWEFLQDEEYLRISNNIYRIRTISEKTLILIYGELEFVFIPL